MSGSGNAGRLRHVVTLHRDAGTTADTYGQPVVSDTTYATRRAEIVPLEGRELWRARQIQADATHTVRLRAGGLLSGTSRLQPKHWLVHEGRTFHVLHVRNVEELNAWLEVLVVERV